MVDLVYSSVAQLQGDQEGLAFLRDAVHGAPSLAGMAKLIDAQFATLNPAARQDAELARELMLNHARRLRVYRCQHCNFRSKTFFWRCPACGEWESFTPNRSEALAV
jgi:lipopolysaccharide biosynthesis regulator YciM